MNYLETMYGKIGYECIKLSLYEKTNLGTLTDQMKDKNIPYFRLFRCRKNNPS